MDDSGFNWFERLIGSVTFWAIALNLAVVVLQLIPLLGIILTAILAATTIAFMIPHLVTVGIILDVAAKRMRWPMLLIPVFVYGAYYMAYFNQQAQVENYAAKMRERNPAAVMRYDPAVHDIVFDNKPGEARELVRGFKIPAAYSRQYNTPQVYRSMSSGLCKEMQAAGVYKPPLSGDNQPRCDFNSHYSRKGPTVTADTARTFEWFEKPLKKEIGIAIEEPRSSSRTDKPALELDVKEEKYIFSFGGKEIARFITAHYYRLPALPAWAYICVVWEQTNCGGEFYSSKQEIDTFPEKYDRAGYGGNVVAALLGLAPYADKQMSDFVAFPGTEAIGRALIDKKKNEKPEDFDQWGARKDDPRQPVIGERNGVPSYEGGIYVYQLGGPFVAFIKENEGKVVYIDGRLDGSGNPSNKGFGLYGVCRKEEDCGAVDHYYEFTEGGDSIWDRKAFTVKGYWQVGAETSGKHSEEDLRTVLQGIDQPK